jgi:hypothetical protein
MAQRLPRLCGDPSPGGAALPIHLLLIPVPPSQPLAVEPLPAHARGRASLVARNHLLSFVLAASAIALCSVISSVIAVHLLAILQAGGLSLASAVTLGALVGPSQVGARVVEMVFGRYYHPIWTMLGATILVTIGLGLLLVGFPIIVLALIPYGAGVGIESIARGTLPLALFGPQNYAALMGRIAFPSLIAQAVAPSVGAALLDYGGAGTTLTVLTALAAANVALVAALFVAARQALLYLP